MTKFRFPELRACPQFWKTGQPSSPTEDQCYFFMMQFSKIEGMPSIPEIWPASHPVQRKVLFWGGKTQKKSAKFFLQLPDTYKKYILQKKWSKTDIPALSSGLNNLHPAIWGCHHQLDDQYRNPNANNRDHLVGQLTTRCCYCCWLQHIIICLKKASRHLTYAALFAIFWSLCVDSQIQEVVIFSVS